MKCTVASQLLLQYLCMGIISHKPQFEPFVSTNLPPPFLVQFDPKHHLLKGVHKYVHQAKILMKEN
jgi:hypothetical protein